MTTKPNFIAHFRAVLSSRQSALCVGLDPELSKLPAALPRTCAGMARFCQELIEATAEYAAAFKINFAFFEAYGHAGWEALERVAAAIPASCLKIADAKRGDIGNTARLYARAIFEELQFDAMTANPYLGEDAALPFLEDARHGVFFLCRTSNPGSGSVQWYPAQPGQRDSGKSQPLFVHIAQLVNSWNQHQNAALVVGATYPSELQIVRQCAPELPFLIPGVGAQGGDLAAAVKHGVTSFGDLAVINVSRGIMYASSGKDFATAAAKQAAALRQEIRQQIDQL